MLNRANGLIRPLSPLSRNAGPTASPTPATAQQAARRAAATGSYVAPSPAQTGSVLPTSAGVPPTLKALRSPYLSSSQPTCESIQALLSRIEAGGTPIRIEPDSKAYVMPVMRRLAKLPAGEELIRLVVQYVPNLVIVHRPGSESQTLGQGNRTVVVLNGRPTGVFDDKGERLRLPDYMVLGHELLHAYHGARWPRVLNALGDIKVPEFTNAEEFATIMGLDPQQAQRLAEAVPGLASVQSLRDYGRISENLLHEQAGLPARYGHAGFDADDNGGVDLASIWQEILSQLNGFELAA